MKLDQAAVQQSMKIYLVSGHLKAIIGICSGLRYYGFGGGV
jgi:hypothetical protein